MALVSCLDCSPEDLLKKLILSTLVSPVWGPAVSQTWEVLTQGCHTVTGACWDHRLKGICLPSYLQKKNGSDPSYIASLTLHNLNQGKCIIQRGEPSLFTLYIYSLCYEFFCWHGRASSPLGQATLVFCCQPGKCLCFGDGEGSLRSSKFSFQLESVFLPWHISVKPLQAPGLYVEGFSSQRALF